MDLKYILGAIAFFIIISYSERGIGVNGNAATNVWAHLFDGDKYNKKIRPVINWTTQTIVKLKLSVVSILDFNVVDETITVTGIISLSWTDEFLTWDPENFDNLSHILIPQDDIWKPFIALENSVVKMGALGDPAMAVKVDSNGTVEWRTVEVLVTTCSVDVSKFPFDKQECGMTFQTTGYGREELEISSDSDSMELHEYEGTSGWVIKSTSVEAEIEEDDLHVICWLMLERKPAYFILNIFLPIALLTLLNIFVFILLVESGEKVSFVVTVFLSLAVFLTIVSREMPENSESISLLNIYVLVSTIMSMLIAIVTLIQIRLHSIGTERPVPKYLKLFTRYNSVSNKTDEQDQKFFKTISERRNSMQGTDAKRKDTNSTTKDNWQKVVRGLDTIFFVGFFLVYMTFTLVWIVVATQK